jgi:diguanylate cyclase (GGDEF)-like protein
MDERMIITYVVVDIICIVLALSMWQSIGSDFGREIEAKAMRRALLSYCSFLLFGLLWLFMENGYLPFVRAIFWVTNMLSLYSLILCAYFWFLFTTSKMNSRIFTKRKWLKLTQLPLWVAAALCASSPLTGWVFTITAEGIYRRGPLFLVWCILVYLYAFLVLVQVVISGSREKHRKKKHQCWLIGVFTTFPVVAGILQIYLSGTPILAPAILATGFLVFNSVQSMQVFSDSLTGLNNRRRAYHFLEERIATASVDSPLVIYMLDINSFKQINDQYGHIEGDKAMKVVASALMRFCQKKHVFAARYGGDEFLIVSTGKQKENPQKFIESFHTLLKQQCKEKKITYPISVCIGYAVVTDPNERVEHAISRADHCLYDDKHRYYDSVNIDESAEVLESLLSESNGE